VSGWDVPALSALEALDGVADQPEHRRPEADEYRAAFSVVALELIHRFRADPERQTQTDAAERQAVEMPSTQARLVKRFAEHAQAFPPNRRV
jgi:hypothetical protein